MLTFQYALKKVENNFFFSTQNIFKHPRQKIKTWTPGDLTVSMISKF